MGCTMSKKELFVGLTSGGGPPKTKNDDDVVSLCSQRKRLLKSAVGRRKIFADAHCKYIRSLHSVSSAVGLFVSTFSPLPSTQHPELRLPSSSSPANTNNIITYEKREDSVGVNYSSGTWSVNSGYGSSDVETGDNDEDREGEENEGQVCEFFYGDDNNNNYNNNNNNNNDRPRPPTPPMPSPQRGFGWDFFSLLDHDPTTIFDVNGTVNVNAVDEGCDRSETKLKRKSIVTSGKIKGNGGVGSGEKNEYVMKKGNALELITALKDLEKHFARACESGLDVSRMLEVNTTQRLLPTVMEHQTEENQSTYVATPLTPAWLRSPSSRSSSCKSLISSKASTSSSSSAWTDCKSDLFDGCGIMESGSHSFTLGRLYAWEKKLYEEVKAGEQARKSYQQKCSNLRKQKQQQGSRNTSNSDSKSSTTELAELYNKILVVSKSSETISNQINKIRDEELQPQLLELMHGLLRTWKAMLESHKTQNKIISKVNSFTSSDDDLTDSQRKATQHLESELKNWLTSFTDYISAQRSYVKCLYSYLSKLIDPTTTDNYHHHNLQPKQDFTSSSLPLTISNGPALLLVCQRWYDSVERLPDKPVKFAMKRLVNDLHETWVQMGEEQDMKRRVENLAREVEKRTAASFISKEVNSTKSGGIVKGWISGINIIVKHHHRGEDLGIAVEVTREKLELEKERHKMSVERTKAVTLNVFTIGFCSVFESMAEFSGESVKLYGELVGFFDENGDQ